jgi:hypothetical protein
MAVNIEVSSLLGQSLTSKSYPHLHAGKNTLSVDAAGLAAGLYLLKVSVGEESVTRLMMVSQ